MTQSLPEQRQELTCATHPNVVTYLRCGKCDTPICPLCLVHTPVGPRCRSCAQLRRLPIFQVSPEAYLLATGASLGLALVAGMLWGALPLGGFLSFFISPAVGYVIGEGVSRVANRRQSAGLKVLVGLGVFLAYVISRGGTAFLLTTGLLFSGTPGPFVTLLTSAIVSTLLNPFAWIVVGIGAYVAVSRVG